MSVVTLALFCIPLVLVFFIVILRSKSPTGPLLLYPLICSILVTGGFVVWAYRVICASKSSTAAIGFIFLPFYSIVVAVAGFLVAWSCLYVVFFAAERLRIISGRKASLLPLALAIVLLAVAGYVAQNQLARYRLLNAAASGTNADSLEEILAAGTSSGDLEVLAKLAKNPNTPVSDLVRIYDFCKHAAAEYNPPECSVVFRLANNPRTPPDILAALALWRQSGIRLVVAVNPSTPTKTLRQLAEDQDGSVKSSAKQMLGSGD
jgi:hypothetical protein